MKLEHPHFHEEMTHPIHGRKVKVFKARAKGFHPMTHADEVVYYYRDKGRRMTVDLWLWAKIAFEKSIQSNDQAEQPAPNKAQ